MMSTSATEPRDLNATPNSNAHLMPLYPCSYVIMFMHVEDKPFPLQPILRCPFALTVTTPSQKQISLLRQSTSPSQLHRRMEGKRRGEGTKIEDSRRTSILIPRSSMRALIPVSTWSWESSVLSANFTGSSPVNISAIGTSDVNTIFAYHVSLRPQQ